MFTHIDLHLETLFILAAAGLVLQMCQRLQRHRSDARPISSEDYLYKIALITGHSEYEIFCKSAENWPVTQDTIDSHFKDYLLHQTTPCYVNACLRKHKPQVDRLRMPPV